MTIEPQRGGVGELYSAEYLRDLCERLQSGYISKLIANEKMKRRDYMDCLEFIKRAMVDADLFIEHHLEAAPPLKVESGEAVSDQEGSLHDIFKDAIISTVEYFNNGAVTYRAPTIDDAVEVLRLSYDGEFQPGEPNIILAALQAIGAVVPKGRTQPNDSLVQQTDQGSAAMTPPAEHDTLATVVAELRADHPFASSRNEFAAVLAWADRLERIDAESPARCTSRTAPPK